MQKHILNTNDQATTELVITLTETPEFDNNQPLIEDHNLKGFGEVYDIVTSLRKAYEELFGKTHFDWPYLRIPFYASTELFNHSPGSFIEGIQKTANELKHNASLTNPLPLNNAVSCPFNVPILRAISVIKTEVNFVENNKSIPLPILDNVDFIEPDIINSNLKSGDLIITGLFRSDKSGVGHGLFLTQERIFVRLPPDDPKWSWENIKDVLNNTCYLKYGIIREGKVWMPTEITVIWEQKESDL